MNKQEFMNIVHEASTDRRKVLVYFSHPVTIPLAKKMQKVEKVTLRFFQLLNDENQIIGYGYKQRAAAMSGYNVKSIPYEDILKIEYPNSEENYEIAKQKYKKYILMNLDDGVWPDLTENIDGILANMFANQYVRVYTNSYANSFEMLEIERYFKERISGNIMLSGARDAYIETSKREKGFYAWLVLGEKSYVLINPRVAVMGRRSI
jgi:hypothetical protein